MQRTLAWRSKSSKKLLIYSTSCSPKKLPRKKLPTLRKYHRIRTSPSNRYFSFPKGYEEGFSLLRDIMCKFAVYKAASISPLSLKLRNSCILFLSVCLAVRLVLFLSWSLLFFYNASTKYFVVTCGRRRGV